MRRVLVYPDAQGLADAAGARLGLAIADAVALRGTADIVLTGGTVGIELLRSLAASPLAGLVDWTSVHIWFGDERFVATGNPDRNEGQAQEALLAKVGIPEENIHRIGASDGFNSVEAAATAYASDIAAAGNPAWDVALFGMGPDGHVASLFPGHPVFLVAGDDAAVAVRESPKPPPERITMTLSTINRARSIWVVAAGDGKALAVARALHADAALPAACVRGTHETLWLIDAAASTEV